MKNFALFGAAVLFTCFSQAQKIQKPATAENFRGLSVPSSKVIWASGTHGTYVKTSDGGTTWKVAQVPDAAILDFRDVKAFSADSAYLLAAGPGEQSRIYKTNDGGQTWSQQFINKDPKGFFDCMGFWDRDHGIAVGDPVNGRFQLIKTDDGGKTWNYIPPETLPAAIEGEGAFAASGTCLVTQGKKNVWFASGGAAARVFHSTDRGKTWTVSETSIAHRKASEGIFSLAFRDSHTGVAVGGDYAQPTSAVNNIAITCDGGHTWTPATWPKTTIYLSGVAYLNKEHLVAVGTSGFMQSIDAGKNWTMIVGKGSNAIAAVTCDSNPCYVEAGTEGRIEESSTVVEVQSASSPK
ncbi:MAG: WD40/YVTN/BNR-like repeat-containing protein [Terriglobales bacterium]|jgi:photosystem II stability/assembly factor-like uncharacterized protein